MKHIPEQNVCKKTASDDENDLDSHEDVTALLQGRVASNRYADQHNHTASIAHSLTKKPLSIADLEKGPSFLAAHRKFQEDVRLMGVQRSVEEPQVNPEDVGIADLANALVHLSAVHWALLCVAMLLWLLWNVYQVILQLGVASQEDETMFRNLGSALTWVTLGVCVIFFNKCLFMKSGAGFGFPHPISLNWFHMFCTAAFTHAIRTVRPDAMPGLSSLNVRTYFCNVVPIAGVQMVALALGNFAYLYISVSYIQMVKNTTSAFVFIFSSMMGFEQPTSARIFAVALVLCGMMLTTSGDQYFNMLGFMMQISSTIADACRLCLTKALMSTKYSVNLDPLSACCASSSTVCMLLTIPMLIIDLPHVTFAEIWDLRLVLCANGLLVVCLNLVSMRFMKKVGPTTYALTGVLKDVLLVVFLLALFGSGVANLEGFGFAMSIVGLLSYNYFNGAGSKA